jgi:hypothetical protein
VLKTINFNMKKAKFKLQEQVGRMLELAGQGPVNGKHLVVVDIQPEYASYFGNNFLRSFINFLNENYESLAALTFLYNGADTLGMVSESDYKMWWLENGLNEEILDMANFYDKGYAFFRYCMDEGIDEEQIVNMIKYMIEKGVNDSRDLDEEFWNEFVERFGNEDIRELLEFAGDAINIPDLMDELRNYRGVVLCGGGINECLKEVEIALQALDKPFNVLTKYTY